MHNAGASDGLLISRSSSLCHFTFFTTCTDEHAVIDGAAHRLLYLPRFLYKMKFVEPAGDGARRIEMANAATFVLVL